jgi:hypothetical protein
MFNPTHSASAPLKPFSWKPAKTWVGTMKNVAQLMNSQVYQINNSKLFAGIIIIILNISSKFVNIKLSKSMESYLRNTFSRNILVFAMVWMGTRDIYIALAMTLMFIGLADYFFNEESKMCCLPEGFTEYHLSLNEDGISKKTTITKEDVEKAKDILRKAKDAGIE